MMHVSRAGDTDRPLEFPAKSRTVNDCDEKRLASRIALLVRVEDTARTSGRNARARRSARGAMALPESTGATRDEITPRSATNPIGLAQTRVLHRFASSIVD